MDHPKAPTPAVRAAASPIELTWLDAEFSKEILRGRSSSEIAGELLRHAGAVRFADGFGGVELYLVHKEAGSILALRLPQAMPAVESLAAKMVIQRRQPDCLVTLSDHRYPGLDTVFVAMDGHLITPSYSERWHFETIVREGELPDISFRRKPDIDIGGCWFVLPRRSDFPEPIWARASEAVNAIASDSVEAS